MTNDWMDDYRQTNDANEKYKLLREEATRLRREGDTFDEDVVVETIRDLSGSVDGHLIVFPANDFGLPLAIRPAELDREVQNEVRQAILAEKYSTRGETRDLDEIRQKLLGEHPAIHKALVCEYTDAEIRYHLPGGRHDNTNFITVREAVGLVDYTTNSHQADGLSLTYRV